MATQTLFTADIDGKNVKKLTDGTRASEDPSWAPDGQSIVYVSVEDGSQMLYVIKIAGGEPRQLTEIVGLDFSPAWGTDSVLRRAGIKYTFDAMGSVETNRTRQQVKDISNEKEIFGICYV